MLELLAGGGLEAHAAVALGPTAFDAARAAREVSAPLLAVSADGALRAGLESNPLLGDDYFVVEEEPLGERAVFSGVAATGDQRTRRGDATAGDSGGGGGGT